MPLTQSVEIIKLLWFIVVVIVVVVIVVVNFEDAATDLIFCFQRRTSTTKPSKKSSAWKKKIKSTFFLTRARTMMTFFASVRPCVRANPRPLPRQREPQLGLLQREDVPALN